MERSCTRESCVRSPHSKREEPGPHNNSCRLPTAQCVATSAASSIEPRAHINSCRLPTAQCVATSAASSIEPRAHINSCRLPTAQCVATSAASSIKPRAHSSFIEFIDSPNSSSLSGCPTPTSPFTTMKDLVSKVRATLSSKNPLTAPCQTDNVRSCPERPAVPCERDSNDVGHSSQIPRASPPKPSTCSVPFILSKTVGCDTFFEGDEDLFGMVKLKHNDVCYTNGTIEWVGRKRTFPLNTGFKTIEEIPDFVKEPSGKKMRRGKTCSDKTYTICGEEIRECDCVDMLPTIYSIVDHLNALHDTVDIVDMRLNTLEDIVTKDK